MENRTSATPAGDARSRVPEAQRHSSPSGNAAPARGHEERHVVIGKGAHIKGEIRNCAKLEIYGHTEGDVEAETLVVHEGGSLFGSANAANARISGNVGGDFNVDGTLDLRAEGSIDGTLSYGQLAVESGAQLVGTLHKRAGSVAQPADTRQQHNDHYDGTYTGIAGAPQSAAPDLAVVSQQGKAKHG